MQLHFRMNSESCTDAPLSFDNGKIIVLIERNFCYLHIPDNRPRTSVEHRHKFFKDHRLPRCVNLDATIGQVDHRSGYVKISSKFLYTGTEPNLLDSPTDEYLNGFHRRYNPCITFMASPNSSNTSSLSEDCRIFVAASIA